MVTSLDMSLDDMMKDRYGNVRGRGRGQGRGRGWGRGRGGSFRGRGMGPGRQGPLGINARSSSYKIAKSFSRSKESIWRHDMFNDSMIAVGYTGAETGTKLYISNLDYGVSNEDIKELFSEVGDLKKCAVHYDRNGRSTGSAEVVYARRSDAMAALKRYNNVHLDGKPMKIEEIGSSIGLPTTRVNVVGGPIGRGRRTVVMNMKPGVGRGTAGSFGGSTRYNRGGFQRGRGQGRGRGRVGRGRGSGRKPAEKSAEELNKELENYHAEAMNTS